MSLPEVENTICTTSWFRYVFAVVDTSEKLYKRLCDQYGVWFKVKGVMSKPGESYEVHLLQIRKRDVPAFRQVAEQVTKTRILMGFVDYPEYCEKLFNRIQSRDMQ